MKKARRGGPCKTKGPPRRAFQNKRPAEAGLSLRHDRVVQRGGRLPATAAAATTTAAAVAAATAAAATVATATAATAAIAATAAAATAAEAAATAAGARTILRLVDTQRATAHRVAVEGLDRARGVFLGHLDEAEATRTTRITVDRQGHGSHSAMLGEQGAHSRLVRRERQVTDIDFRHLWKHSHKMKTTHRPQRKPPKPPDRCRFGDADRRSSAQRCSQKGNDHLGVYHKPPV